MRQSGGCGGAKRYAKAETAERRKTALKQRLQEGARREQRKKMNLEELAIAKDAYLTANDREMLRTVLKNKEAAGEMNSTRLAEFLHVSRTTLVRLMRKLGLGSFAEFKLLLRREEQEREAAVDMRQVAENYHMMIDGLKKHSYENVCRILFEAGTIYLYGTGNEQKAIAEEMKRIFLLFGKNCMDLFDLGEVELARKNFRKKDVFLAISLSGETEEALRILRLLQDTEVQTVSLTRWENNSLARMCRESLYVGTRTVRQTGSPAYEMVAAFYIMLDILTVHYLEYASRRKKEAENED